MIILAACCLGLACAETARYRVLSFFLDGVPEPGKAAPAEGGPDTLVASSEAGEISVDTAAGRRREDTDPADRTLVHPPYREFRCGGCHASDSGLVLITPQEGLCDPCHGNVPGDVPYVHGPVAVKDCLFCHHHHGGFHPHVLRSAPTDTCLRCHNRADLTEGEHHPTGRSLACIRCHHAHGGLDPFFLKQNEP